LKRGALLERGADDHVFNLARLDLRALRCVLDGVTTQFLRRGVVERAAIGLADRRARG